MRALVRSLLFAWSALFVLVGINAMGNSEAAAQRSGTESEGLGLLRCAFLLGIDATGPQFLNLSASAFNSAGIFTTSESSTLRVALNMNRKSHVLANNLSGDARATERDKVLESLAGSLERVAATKLVVLLNAEGGKARLLRKGTEKWVALSVDSPKDKSAAGLQRWLMALYGYNAVVSESRGGGKVFLRAAPGLLGAGAERSPAQDEGRQGVVLESSPGRPLEKNALAAKPLALVACRGGQETSVCDTLLTPAGDDGSSLVLAPGTPVWFPEAK
jgi:hypothetical protein